MTKEIDEKFFDVRLRDRHLQKGVIKKSDVQKHLQALPNDESNFELVMIAEDDIGVGEEFSDEEIKAMPDITEENLDDFDFMETEDEGKNKAS